MTTTAAREREIATWAGKAREATTRRDRAIHRARADGMSLRHIATAAGLTHSAVAKILARPTP